VLWSPSDLILSEPGRRLRITCSSKLSRMSRHNCAFMIWTETSLSESNFPASVVSRN